MAVSTAARRGEPGGTRVTTQLHLFPTAPFPERCGPLTPEQIRKLRDAEERDRWGRWPDGETECVWSELLC